MLMELKTGDETLPCVVGLSGAYAVGQVTSREYNTGLRVAALEDSVKRPFCQATWAEVQVGDIVLMAWLWPNRRKIEIAKVEIASISTEPGLNGTPLVIARFVAFDNLEFGQAFDPEETAYVQSRF